ncbi:MAG: hypothetical protein ACYC3Q_11485 [Gemmatimonadaceae bacterium]
MKKLLLGLLIGFAIGYYSGYGDASRGEPSIARRIMDKFGASRIQEENARRDHMLDSATSR